MTQPTDRPGIDHLTSDQLDALYREIDTLRAVCQSNKQAYVGAVKSAWAAEERAKQAEATLTAVRELATQWAILRAHGSAATELRAVLDQHGQTPA
ncbi:hypothetical protein [Streptomyces gardneri]|uniref:hypothetical protein n=1 Tax=Streptomyces gardneri TaxID=66892 RepID=UPI0035D7B289